jgi:transposase
MHGWEQRVLVKHYLEQGLSKSAIAERVGVSRRASYGGGRRPQSGTSDRPATKAVPAGLTRNGQGTRRKRAWLDCSATSLHRPL